MYRGWPRGPRNLKEEMKNEIISNLAYAYEHGTDREEITNWIWPLRRRIYAGNVPGCSQAHGSDKYEE